MFYKQFSKIIDSINPEFVEDFDYWLATIPDSKQDNISASLISSRFNVPYSLADIILKFCYKEGILEQYYLIQCPNEDCNMPLEKVTLNELAEVLMNPVFCTNCFKEYSISPNNILTVYKRKVKPDISEDQINIEILKRLNFSDNVNFNKADSLEQNKIVLYSAFYNPDESAYKKFNEMRKALDFDYGSNTTAKGNALEALALELYKEIKFVTGTNEIRTYTNQFDCTIKVSFKTIYPTIFDLLTPYFIIECKNEPDDTPSNTYFNKLLSIMETNEAKVGIVFSRRPAARESKGIAYQHYLINKRLPKCIYMISMCDDDLKMLIDCRVNILEYMDFKMLEMTTNCKNAKFEMFRLTNGEKIEYL